MGWILSNSRGRCLICAWHKDATASTTSAVLTSTRAPAKNWRWKQEVTQCDGQMVIRSSVHALSAGSLYSSALFAFNCARCHMSTFAGSWLRFTTLDPSSFRPPAFTVKESILEVARMDTRALILTKLPSSSRFPILTRALTATRTRTVRLLKGNEN